MTLIYKILNWFTKSWWQYLLEKPCNPKKFFCRANGHKCGVIYFNPGGYEPNMHCKNCDDDLG